jgi:methylisocitrate lyase
MAAAVGVPVSADFEGGFADDPLHVAENVTRAAGTGIAGLSIEDATGDAADPLYEFELAVERIRAARRAIDASGTGLVLTGRSEGFVVGRPDLEETIRRLCAYAEAGADCLYAPRIDTVEQVVAIVAAVSPKPVNLLVNSPFLTVAEAADLGVRRISVGGTLARTAWEGLLESAREIARWERSSDSSNSRTSTPCSGRTRPVHSDWARNAGVTAPPTSQSPRTQSPSYQTGSSSIRARKSRYRAS